MPDSLLPSPQRPQTPPGVAPPRTAVPAWLLSTVVHLLLLIVLVLLVGRIPAGQSTESPRRVAIALVQPNADPARRYLTEGQAETAQSAPPSDSQTAAVPDAPPPAIPDIQLPARQPLDVGRANADRLVAVPRLDARGRGPILPGLNDQAILAEEAARRAGVADRGSPGELSIFGGDSITAHSFIFVIDRSKSMGAEGLGALSAAAKELSQELRRLQPRHKFQIIAYNHTPLYLGERRLLPATPENVGKVQGYFASLVAYGATAHETALLSALRRKPDALVLLTDGGDPYLTEAQLGRIKSRAGRDTTIHCIQFGYGAEPQGGDFMRKLASQNRGGYRYVDMATWK